MASMIKASCVSFGITFCLVPLLRALAFKTNILDVPNGVLKKHALSTPYLGGVAVFFGVMGASYWYFFTAPLFFYIGLILLLILGLVDDIYAISPGKKFLGQVLACFCFLKAGLLFNQQLFYDLLPVFLHVPHLLIFLNGVLSSWWILTVINAFNLVDVMDGLTSVIAFFSSVGFIGFALFFNNAGISVWMSILAGSLVAFFWYNKPRASIYLGDAGSLFIGGCLATVPFFLGWGASTSGDLLVPLMLLFIPLFELSSLIIIRISKNLPVYYGSPHHFICYLKMRGYSVKQILCLVGMVGLFINGTALFVAFENIAPLLAIGISALFIILSVYFVFFAKKISFF